MNRSALLKDAYPRLPLISNVIYNKTKIARGWEYSNDAAFLSTYPDDMDPGAR